MKKIKNKYSIFIISAIAIFAILLFISRYYFHQNSNNTSLENKKYNGTWESENGILLIIKENQGTLYPIYPNKDNNEYYKGNIEIRKGNDAIKELGVNDNFIISFSKILKNNGYSKDFSINDIYSVKFCADSKKSTVSWEGCSSFALVPYNETSFYMYEYNYNTATFPGFLGCRYSANKHYSYICGYIFEKR